MSLLPDAQHPKLKMDGDGRSPAHLGQIVVIDSENILPCSLSTDSLPRFPELSIQKHAALDEWLTSPAFSNDVVILLCFRNQLRSAIPESVKLDCGLLRSNSSDLTYALVADQDGPLKLPDLLSLGVRGFLSADLPAKIFAKALSLISSGFQFFNASCFMGEKSERKF